MTVETPAGRSPLAGCDATFAQLPAGLRAEELPFRTQLSLRLDPETRAAAAVERVLGCPLPAPCAVTRSPHAEAEAEEQEEAAWLGPDEFLLLAPPGARTSLRRRVEAAIGAEFGTVTDVSAQRTTVRLSGPLTRDVLARGCAIDLDPRISPPGTCVQTLLARSGVILLVDAPAQIRLLVRSSFAPYLADWLADACADCERRAW